MRVRYIIEIITENRTPKNEIDLTVQDLKEFKGAKVIDYDARDNYGFVEVLYDAPLKNQLYFAARFLPTIFELESKIDDMSARDYWSIILDIAYKIHAISPIVYGKSFQPNRASFTREDYEKKILEDRLVDVIFALKEGVNPSPYFIDSYVLTENKHDGFHAFRVLAPVQVATEAVLMSPPTTIYPVAPEVYDFRVDELLDVFQSIAEISRYALTEALKKGQKLQR